MDSKNDSQIRETMPLVDGSADAGPTALPQERRASLLVYHRDGVEVVPLRPNEPITIGRDPPAGVRIQDPGLSREHARFLLAGHQVSVEDLGSRNGTSVDGRRIDRAEPCVIQPGVEVAIGTLRAFVHMSSPTDGEILGLRSHERFRVALEDEVVRARHFGRPLSVLLVRAERHPASHVGRWGARLLSLLRPVDCAALYSKEAIEILLSETSGEAALKLAHDIVNGRAEGDPPLFVGVSFFPDVATDAESLSELSLSAVQRATAKLPVQLAGTPAQLPGEGSVGGLLGDKPVFASPAMKKVSDAIRRVAGTSMTMLIQGETGVGKEVIARAIHALGPRRNRPMIPVNCGAISSELVESTLFGHMRGAFTGAYQDRKGVFEAAHEGTVLLDEIGELPLQAQASLLRVLDTKHVTRVGSTREVPVDVRVIAATNRDLDAMVAKETFRQDLLYRLNMMPILVPPLRERTAEIELLAMRFLGEANKANGRKVEGFAPGVLALMKSYPWPGNVRELKNAMDRAVVIANTEKITEEDLPERVRAMRRGTPSTASGSAHGEGKRSTAKEGGTERAESLIESLKVSMQRHEKECIIAALVAAGGNQTKAAKLLGIPLRTLAHKIKKHGIKRRGYGAP